MKRFKKTAALILLCMTFLLGATLVYSAKAYANAPETTQAETHETAETVITEDGQAKIISSKAIAAAIAIAIASAVGAISMSLAGMKASESIARQPDAEGSIRTSLMLNLVFIETAIIYALLAVILIIFVL